MDDYVIVMKVGPHSHMTLEEIIESKKEEEKIHGVHFWGYSGVFCQPAKVQDFCEKAKKENQKVHLILLETKSNYDSSIGYITQYSKDGIHYENFKGPVQLQGAQFSFVGKNLKYPIRLVTIILFLFKLTIVDNVSSLVTCKSGLAAKDSLVKKSSIGNK